MSLHEKYMRLAFEKARQGITKGQTPFGSCIVKNGTILSCAHNTVWKDTNITAHAEINAIRLACRKINSIDLSGSVLYSTCEPCPMCFSACHWARISKVYYAASIRDAQTAGFNELTISSARMKKNGGSQVILVKDFLRTEGQGLFGQWLRNNKRKAY